jgi:amidohydrolase
MIDLVKKSVLEEIQEARRYLHQHPEVSQEEQQTAQYITSQLEPLQPSRLITNLGGYGVAAIFDSGNSGPTLLFRAELDALPIQEVNEGLPYKSVHEGVAHKCGHDGHMAVLLGLAKSLSEEPPPSGRVITLFQPAEEIGAGARAVLEDEKFAQLLPIDHAFAFHNLPGFPLGQVVVKEGPFSASVKSIAIRLEGKTAHAGEPENGINPALAIAEILQAAEEAAHPNLDDDDFAILTAIHIRMGEIAYGVSAGEGELHLTIRTWTEEKMEKLSERLMTYLKKISSRHQLKLNTEWTNVFLTNKNDVAASNVIRKAAKALGLDLYEKKYPFKWGEDFGAFTQQYPGAMFGLGSGEQVPALHNPDYDFPDELLEAGVNIFRKTVDLILAD